MLRDMPNSWGAISKSLHWLMALLIFVQFALGGLAVTWHLSPVKLNLFIWHKSIGMLILALVVVRIIWRLLNTRPGLPADMAQWERQGARVSHFMLYLLMVTMVMSGWVINSAANIPLKVFWLFPLPNIAPPGKPLEELAKDIHLSLFIVLATVLVIHISAALRHHFIKKNDILVRMLPFGKTKQ